MWSGLHRGHRGRIADCGLNPRVLSRIDDAGIQPLEIFFRFIPGAMPQAGVESAVGAEAGTQE
jgi:hypothetical protein